MLKGCVKNNDLVDDRFTLYEVTLSFKNKVLHLAMLNGTGFAYSFDHWQSFKIIHNPRNLKGVKMKRLNSIKLGTAAAMGLSLALLVSTVHAVPYTATANLTGDIRDDNPDNLIASLTVTFDDTSQVSNWTFDINSPAHPNIKLDELYFNVDTLASNVGWSGFDPTGWDIQSPASVQGAGGTTFQFEALDPSGPPNAADVTNTQDLTFVGTLVSGNWIPDIFNNAVTAISNDAGNGQVGAHLQALTTAGNCPNNPDCSDSGFAFGDWVVTTGGETGEPPEGGELPEPSTVLLIGSSLAGFGLWRLGRKQK